MYFDGSDEPVLLNSPRLIAGNVTPTLIERGRSFFSRRIV
jgi:hypothetical protein